MSAWRECPVSVHAATWMDQQLTGADKIALACSGYGQEVRRALALRQQWLIEQQLAQRQRKGVVYRRDLIRVLTEREVQALVGPLSKRVGLPFADTVPGERVSGTLRGKVDITSGRFALIESARTFTLVPWRDELERHVGKRMSGLMRQDRPISWTISRERSLGAGTMGAL